MVDALDEKYETLIQTAADIRLLESITGGPFALSFHALYRLYQRICAENAAIHHRQISVPSNPSVNEKMHLKRISHNLGRGHAIELNILWALDDKLNTFITLKQNSHYEY